MTLSLQFDSSAPSGDVVSVSDVTGAIARLIQSQSREVWVRGEVAEYKVYGSGHHYFTLRDSRAQMRCTIWRQHAHRITAPAIGTEVFVFGRPAFWDEKGEFRFSVTQLVPTSAVGAAQRELERVRALLQAEGLLDPARKRPLPALPSTIAVVTSKDGAALRDIVTVTRRRWPSVQLLVVGARVQGEGAPETIARALQLVNRLPEVDLCIVARGGGARDDLAAFNTELVCRALAAVRVPTISAVGHETDISLTDFVADARAATPSAAAETAVPDRRAVQRSVEDLAGRMAQGLVRRTRLADERLGRFSDRVASAMEQMLVRRRHAVERLAAQLDALSPLRVLERGFSMATDAEGRVLRRLADFPAGRAFRLRVSDGQVTARVEQETA